MTERIAPLLRWAEGYYPSRLIEPPDIAGMRRAHHALVDQPAIRNRLSDTTLSEAASAAWLRTQ
jgi:hypothetical protein